LFKARYAQRRAAYNEEIQHRLTGKLVKVAEAALDHTLVALEKKKDSVPLPLLKDITSDALDRLGYGVSPRAPSGAPGIVNVNVQATGQQVQEVQVTREALASARDKLRQVEANNSTAVARLSGSGRLDEVGEGKLIEGDLGAL
jgi:hypothetical protein